MKKKKRQSLRDEVLAIKIAAAPEDKSRKVLDDILADPGLWDTLRDALSRKGYVLVTEDSLVRALGQKRVVPGNEARTIARLVIKECDKNLNIISLPKDETK
jgi:hypothetical protein